MRTKIAFIILTLALLLGLAEVVARILVYRGTPAGVEFDEDINYTYRPFSHPNQPGVDGLNDIGCIGDNVKPPKTTDELRVLLLGASTSFSQKYVTTVRSRLAEGLRSKDVKVVSCGRPQYTSYSNRVNFDKNLQVYLFDIVGLYMGATDNIYNSMRWLNDNPNVGHFDWGTLRRSVLWDLIEYHKLEKLVWATPDFALLPLRSGDIFAKNVRGIVESAKRKNAIVVLVPEAISYPTEDKNLFAIQTKQEALLRHFWGNLNSMVVGLEKHKEIMIALAKDLSLPIVEVADSLPHTSEYFIDISHLTDAGNEILGTKMADAMRDSLTNRISSIGSVNKN